jgi:hypothetical protein
MHFAIAHGRAWPTLWADAMQWIAPSERDHDNAALEKGHWDAADQFRANSGLKSQEYSVPLLGLIFLRFAKVRFATQRARLETPSPVASRQPRTFATLLDTLLPKPLSGELPINQ